MSYFAHDPINRQRRRLLAYVGMIATVMSSAGSSLAFAAASRRIVSIGGALTEIIYALNAGHELVGVDTTSTYPEDAKKLPQVGYTRALSVEGVLALSPTQVIATEDSGPPAVLRQITQLGVPVAILAANHRFEGLLARVLRIGDITARATQAAQLMRQLREQWRQTQAQIAARRSHNKSLRVLFILSPTPSQMMVAGRQTSANAMLAYAGAVNAIHGFTGYKPLTPESAIAAKPDIILLTDQGLKGLGGLPGLLKYPGIAYTPAGRAQRVVSLEAMFLLGFGPRLPAAVQALDTAFSRVLAV